MNYDLYLFSNLFKLYDKEFDAMPYDEQYEMLPELFYQFQKSTFNDESKGLYECIINYCKYYFPQH